MGKRIVRPETFSMWNIMNFTDRKLAAKWRQEEVCLCEVARNRKTSLVDLHRDALGPSYLFHGNRRYNTWDGPGWRIYVNNGYGVKFEVTIPEPQGMPSDDPALQEKHQHEVDAALALWESYLAAIKVSHTELDPLVDVWMKRYEKMFGEMAKNK